MWDLTLGMFSWHHTKSIFLLVFLLFLLQGLFFLIQNYHQMQMIEIKLLPNLFSLWRVAELSELDTKG